MARTDNYLIQAQQAKSCFLTYDAEALAKKLNAKLDADFLYTTFFGQSYRVSRKTGDIQRRKRRKPLPECEPVRTAPERSVP